MQKMSQGFKKLPHPFSLPRQTRHIKKVQSLFYPNPTQTHFLTE